MAIPKSDGYKVGLDCDLKSYFDTMHHQRMRAYLEDFISDKTILTLLWNFLRSEILDKDIYIDTIQVWCTARWTSVSNLSEYLLKYVGYRVGKRGRHFIRYADDFIILVKSK